MTINRRPTFNYSQPKEYRFSHDSVFLAQVVFDRLKTQIHRDTRILDLCAGCGIVGMDFLFHCRQELGFVPQLVDFVEIQSEYRSHFEENRARLNVPTQLNFINTCYSQLLESNHQYDLIICNPPYFHPEKGVLSPSAFKNRCRFFIDSDFLSLLAAVQRLLSPQGEAYLLLRDLKNLPSSSLQIEHVGDIRGTHLLRLRVPNVVTHGFA